MCLIYIDLPRPWFFRVVDWEIERWFKSGWTSGCFHELGEIIHVLGSRQATEETLDLWKSTRCVKVLGMSINLFFTLGSSAPNFWHQRMDTSSKRETWIQIPQEKMVLLMVQKSGDHQLRLVVYPLIHPRWPGGAGFLPSTAWSWPIEIFCIGYVTNLVSLSSLPSA